MRYVKKNRGGLTLLSSGRNAVVVVTVIPWVVAEAENKNL